MEPIKEIHLNEELIQQTLNQPVYKKEKPPDFLKLVAQKNKQKRRLSKAALKNLREYNIYPGDRKKSLDILKQANAEVVKEVQKIVLPASIKNIEKLKEILDEAELKEYMDIWKRYYEEFGGDINSSSDYDDLCELCMNYIDLYRLQQMKKKTKKLVADPYFDKNCHNVHLRIQTIKTALKTRRKDRMESDSYKENNIVSHLAKRANNVKTFIEDAEKKLKIQEAEEWELLKKQ